VIQATGTGKSLIYQYFSLVSKGTVLVVTPLISLMNDQIMKMPKCISAACINSYHTQEQRNTILHAFNNGYLNVLMMSPERLFLESVNFTNVSLICIDEAHCISEWSHNFRPSYLRIEGMLKEKLPNLPKLALTATATLKTVQSVSQALNIKPHAVIRTTDISRTNITATVTRDSDKAQALIMLLRSEKYKNIKSIIVYCTYKKTTERVKRFLRDNGISAEAYHAGLSDIDRQKVYKEFEDNNVRVLVATIAFGMGIDKKDIQGIIHFDMPKSIENYLQEIGRAGRDGEHAYCHLFLSDADLFEIRKLIFLDHVDMEEVSKIMNKVMSSAYSKWLQSNSNKEKCFVPKKRRRDQLDIIPEDITLDKGIYITLPLNELCKLLDIKEQVVITILSRGEKESKGDECYKFYGVLPEVCNIRFYK
jgi:ATP-dependent DNA helicase Q4